MKKNRSIYFIGIGGIGMSALARYLKNKKFTVWGSDAMRSTITDELKKEGVKVIIGHKKGAIMPHTDLVIYNRAIKSDNPELLAAQNADIPIVSYAEALGVITKKYTTIAITGSHGKSTTTALAGLTLVRAGLNPTILVGTKLKDLGGKNIRAGKSPYLILEADDFQAAFLHYSPFISIVTNIDREHMDFYKNFANVKAAFLAFLSRTRRGGVLILNRDDAPLYSLKKKIDTLAKRSGLSVVWYSLKDATTAKIKPKITISGKHNLSNASAVYQLGKVLKIPEKKILTGIASYRGAWRRMEYRGKIKMDNHAVMVFDDYAHHPTEIKATLAAFKERFPKSFLVCVFQPHQGKRLAALFKEFQTSFEAADALFITPIYKVMGRDEKFTKDSAALVRVLQKRFPKKLIFYLEDEKNIKSALTTLLASLPPKTIPSPILVMMGAGDIVATTNMIMGKQS